MSDTTELAGRILDLVSVHHEGFRLDARECFPMMMQGVDDEAAAMIDAWLAERREVKPLYSMRTMAENASPQTPQNGPESIARARAQNAGRWAG